MENLCKDFLKRVGLGKLVTKRGKTKRPRSRTLHTYQNKIQKLKSQYNKNIKSEKFKIKYPTFESFRGNYKLKEKNK